MSVHGELLFIIINIHNIARIVSCEEKSTVFKIYEDCNSFTQVLRTRWVGVFPAAPASAAPAAAVRDRSSLRLA